ncbi:MAG: DUF2478 domain-containing protein, partial [Bacteroidetes bacterium]|nr:DUF2478 domain-containing protein [Bacteroidota bacterium]
MPRRINSYLSETWLKAAVVGSLWASFEIIIGSFLHNLRVPFAGTILSFASVAMIIAFVQVWRDKGLIWRAGLIAALLKSISPSAIIIGPMLGIFSEALILEFFILIFGRNLFAYMIGGAIAVLSALLHRIVTLLIMYGFDLLVIIDQLYKYIIKQLGMTEGDPVLLISSIMLVYIVFGIIGAVLGYLGGLKARTMAAVAGAEISTDNESSFFRQAKEVKSSPWFLLYHLFCMVICLYIINIFPIWLSLLPALGYASFCLVWYRGSMRSFRKPSFWIWFMSITLLAAVFWNGLSKGEIWDLEGLIIGLKMNLRAIVILTGFSAMSRELRNPVIRTVLYHHGFANVYHSIGLAFSVLPGIIDSLPGVKRIIRKPVSSLGMIISRAIDVYPVLKKELAEQTSLIVITGEIQQGKTTYLANIIASLREKGIRINGIIARGIHKGEERIGYDLEDISTGGKHIYIRKEYFPGWFRYGKYCFSPEGLEFGKHILQNITEENTDLIVIDEIGPVEMKGRGWADDIERLLSTNQIPQLWVVRKSLFKKAIRQWNVGEVLVIDISKETVENII